MNKLNSFNSDSSFFALISTDNHIEIWDCLTNTLRQTLTDPNQLHISYSAIYWIIPNNEKSKKRKRVPVDGLGQLLLGTTTGQVQIWDLGTGVIIKNIDSGKEEISAICVNKNCGEIYFTAKNVLYDYHWSGELIAKYSMRHSCSHLMLSEDETLVFTASSGVIMWCFGEELKQVGRCSTIDKDIKFLKGIKGTKYILAGSGRGVQIFETQPKLKCVCSCICEGNVVNYAITDLDQISRLLVIHSNGIDIFSLNFSNLEAQVSPVKSIATTLHLISLDCHSTLKIVNDNDKTLEFIEISDFMNDEAIDKAIQNSVIADKAPDDLYTKKALTEKTHIIGAQDTAISTPNMEPTKKSKLNLEEVELSQRIEEFSTATDSFIKKQKKNTETIEPKDVSSIQTLLTQALQTNDKSALSACLATRKSNIIYNTVRKLTIDESVKLLDVCVKKFEKKPRTGYDVFPWIKAVLSINCDSFISSTELNSKLNFLRKLIDNRSKPNLKLCELLGRLDFMENQMNLLKEDDKNVLEPISHYKETLEVGEEDEVDINDFTDV